MIEIEKIGSTHLNGEIYYLKSDNPFEIPAIRIFVSSHLKPEELKGKIKGIKTLDFIELINKNKFDVKNYVKNILSYFHGDIGEMGYQGYYFKDVSRVSSFLTWIPIGAPRGIPGVGTERSLRYLSAKSFVKFGRREENLYETYEKLKEMGVKKEDARDVLPSSVSTELILQIPSGRYVEKWANTMKKFHSYLKEMYEIAETVKNHNKKISGFESPIEEIATSRFALRKENSMIKDIKFKKDFHFDKITESIVAFWEAPFRGVHQDVRNRQVFHYWPSWEEVIKKISFYSLYPYDKKIKAVFNEAYQDSKRRTIEFWKEKNYEDAIYSIPLGTMLRYASRISGKENIRYTIMLRTCTRAQLEIRLRYWKMARFLEKNEFGEKLGPRCVLENRCFEPEKENCPMYKKFVKK